MMVEDDRSTNLVGFTVELEAVIGTRRMQVVPRSFQRWRLSLTSCTLVTTSNC